MTDDTGCAMRSAVELVNSAEDPDTLTKVEDLAKFYYRNEYTGAFTGTREELDAVRAVRPVLRALLTSDRDGAVDHINRILADAQACPQLVRHGATDWHLHAVTGDRPLDVRIAVETAMAMIDVVRGDELDRLGVCADPDCNGLVLDLSRNRSRRFCSTACGNRAAVAAYRSRRSAER